MAIVCVAAKEKKTLFKKRKENSMPIDSRLKILAAASGLKLALAPGYRSTDFEVHRNWLAVTHALPLKEWYVGRKDEAFFARPIEGDGERSFVSKKKTQNNRYLDATSEWTLDYPPLFAYFERALACLAALVAPRALSLQKEPVNDDPATVAFQRLSVAAADLALAAVAWRLTNKKSSRFPSWVPFLLVFASPGLLIVDSIHFQYNAPLIALLLFAVSKAQESQGRKEDLVAAAAFAALVCSKHLFACLGPLFALHFLGRCLGRGKAAMLDAESSGKGKSSSAASAVAASASLALPLAAIVTLVVAAAFGPFALSKPSSLGPFLARLFPFDRGLLHAYWAANAWALAAGADVALSAASKVLAPKIPLLLPLAENKGSGLASGLVQRTRFAVLPTPGAGAAALCVLLAQAPALVSALRSGFVSAAADAASPKTRGGKGKTRSPKSSATTPSFAAAAQYCLLCSFVWGYHVHEKAILPALALSAWRAFCCCDESESNEDGEDGGGSDGGDTATDDGRVIARGPRSYFRLSLPALHALLPLLAPAPAERAAAFLLLAAHALFLLSSDSVIKVSPPGFSPLERAAALLLCSLEVACVLAFPLLLPRLPFAPLAATSLACALGVCGCWLADALRWWRVALFFRGRGKEEEGAKGKKGAATTTRRKAGAAAAAAATETETMTTTSASPSLAARRPRRAAAAAAKA